MVSSKVFFDFITLHYVRGDSGKCSYLFNARRFKFLSLLLFLLLFSEDIRDRKKYSWRNVGKGGLRQILGLSANQN